MQLELKNTQFELSQVFNSYDPDPNINSPVRVAENGSSVRLGGRYADSSSSNWIYTMGRETRRRSGFDIRFDVFIVRIDAASTDFELQRWWTAGRVQLLAGLRRLSTEDNYDTGDRIATGSTDFYLYAIWNPASQVSIQGGFSYDDFVVDNSIFPNSVKRRRLSPKFGLVWSPRPETTIRLAAFSSVKRRLIGNQTIEPTQLAGFNQFFTGFDALFGEQGMSWS